MIGKFFRWLLSAAEPRKRYSIVRTDFGFMALFDDGIGLRAIKKDGTCGIYMPDAGASSTYSHKDEAGAGACVNAHSRLEKTEVVWRG